MNRVAFRRGVELGGGMEIIALQWNLAWEQKAANFRRVEELVEEAAPETGSLVVLPEMFATGFSMNLEEIGEAPTGETFSFLAALARRYSVYVLGGMAVHGAGGRGSNQAVILAPDGSEVIRYHKMHPFRYAGEGDHFEAGPKPVLWKWGDLVVAPFICYDLRFPEIYRLAAVAGAELFVTIANWPASRIEHWKVLTRARAIENQAYAIGVNRCGEDPTLKYPGATMAVDPRGEVVTALDETEGWCKVSIDPDALRSYREDFPFLKDLRKELFAAGEV